MSSAAPFLPFLPSAGVDAACAAAYFNNNFNHCDWGNAPGSGGLDPQPWAFGAGVFGYEEGIVVRAVPEPAALALFGLGTLVVRMRRSRRAK